MTTDIPSSDNEAVRPGSKSFSSRIPSVVFALAVSACAIYAAANGPILYSAAQHLKTEQLRQEDRIFCEKFNMPPGSESFRTCVVHLSEVRRLHRDRVAAEAAGVP
ncbi:MAG TPA: hypothetical protein VIR82_00970 [Bradyrhizobium sp.]|jgi:hypothetical protein